MANRPGLISKTFTNSDKFHRCGFCDKRIKSFVYCPTCLTRVYCSVVCKEKDRTEEGQIHKIWCERSCGDENFGWVLQHGQEVLQGQEGHQVREGQGGHGRVVALKEFERGSIIMIERGKLVQKSDLSLEENFGKSCSLNQSSSSL